MAKYNKIGLIIAHEYKVRVQKKSFWLVGLLTPLLLVGLGALIGFLAVVNEKDSSQIAVYDQSGRIFSQLKAQDNVEFLNIDSTIPIDSIKSMVKNSEMIKGVLFIPQDTTLTYSVIEKGSAIYYSENVPKTIINNLSRQIESIIQDQKIQLLGVDPQILASTKTNVTIANIDISSEDGEKQIGEVAQGVKYGIALMLAFMLYMFIFMSGNMVMSSTLEEKTSRIVEVIISSVKPFEMMMGKIISCGLVSLTQLAIWIVMFTGLSIAGIGVFASTQSDQIAQVSQAAQDPEMVQAMSNASTDMSNISKIMGELAQIDFVSIVLVFLFFFIMGYLLYAAMFAAVGSAVDSANDASQFILPVTIPMIVGLYCAMTIINNPHGPVGFWLSMIPFTSPIVMMVRVPFGVPLWEILLSATLLIITFVGMVWIAGKIYRTGLLMYGTKPTYKDLWKWIRQS